jgi:aryl-alcohol dehydrogenase-like predicted oxidoreductase
MHRRDFLKASLAAVAMLPALRRGSSGYDVPRRMLGSTGESVSIVGIGGYHLGRPNVTEADSIRIVRTAIDRGVNFLDNCWDYNGGISEIRMGKALRDGYRERVFVMTKLDGRNARTAAEELDDSLRRLQTDLIDLIQFHEIIRYSDGPDLRARRCVQSVTQGETGGKGALHWIHWSQESRHPSGNAENRLGSELYL